MRPGSCESHKMLSTGVSDNIGLIGMLLRNVGQTVRDARDNE